MKLLKLILLYLFLISPTQADTIYELIKIPNLEIYNLKTENKLRYLNAKQAFTIGVDNNINCFKSSKQDLDKKYKIIEKNLNRYSQNFLKKIIDELRLSFLPPLLIYLAAGTSGMTSIVGTFYVKEYLNLSASFIASLGFWITLPWALKMPVGHLVDLAWKRKNYLN